MEERKNIMVLFDVDGTLTKPVNKITQDMIDLLLQLKKKVYIGLVGGSDLKKIREQVTDLIIQEADVVFTENGLYALKNGKFFCKRSVSEEIGEEALKKFINYVLHYIADLDIPIKRGTFVEYRNGMLNISPIGRNCSQEERDEFEKYDMEHKIRETMVANLREKFADINLTFSIGGQISFDAFPRGWDKSYCLQYVEEYEDVYFFGDKTHKGGNDHEIFVHERTKGYTVKGPEDTKKYINELFFS